MDDGMLVGFIRDHWKCSHTAEGRSIVRDGYCGRCGCARDDYSFTVHAGNRLTSALNGYAFVHDNKVIWYRDALYELGLLENLGVEEQWQPVEEAEKLK